MPVIHEINCHCCEPKSEGVSLILEKIQQILGTSTEPSFGAVEALKEVSDLFKKADLSEANKQRLAAGMGPYVSAPGNSNIDDIVEIAKIFLSTPVTEVPVEQLQLDDVNKKIGKFNVADLSDVPGLDITKLIDLSKIDLSMLDKLTFSISTLSMTAEKTLNVGPVSLGFKFIISLTEIAWFPIVGVDKSIPDSKKKKLNLPKPETVEDLKKNIAIQKEADNAQALAALKDVKTTQLVTASSTKTTTIEKPDPKDPSKTIKLTVKVPLTLSDMKTMALKNYSSSKDVTKAINNSTTKEDLINVLSALGIVLYQEVNIQDEMKAILDNEKLLKITPDFEDEDCGTPDVVVAPFSAEDIKAIQEDCCSDEKPPVVDTNIDFKNTQDILAQIVKNNPPNNGYTPEDEAKEVEDIQNFIKDIEAVNDKMTQCAKEKQNALNNYWWYQEAAYLNEIVLEYTEARANMLDKLNGSFASLEKTRNEKIEKNISLKNQENKLILDTYKRLGFKDTNLTSTVVSTEKPALKLGDVEIKKIQVDSIEKDLTFKAAVSAIREEFKKNETVIQSLTTQIEDSKKNYKLPVFSNNDLENLRTIDLKDEKSTLKIKTKEFRKSFNIAASAISNQVGFDFRPLSVTTVTNTIGNSKVTNQVITGSSFPGSELNLFIDSSIYDEAKTLFAMGSPEQGDVTDYIKKIETREKTFGEIWNNYYSPNRIDLLFTYKEQGYTNPKPQYDETGNPLGPKTTITIQNPLGGSEKMKVAESVTKLDINEEIALDFWRNLESKTNDKMLLLLKQWKASSKYTSYIKSIRTAAENEAKYAFSVNLIYQENSFLVRSFDSLTNSFKFNQSITNSSLKVNAGTSKLSDSFKDLYTMSYESVKQFQKSIESKIDSINAFMELKKKCIAEGEKEIEEKAINLSNKKNTLNKKKEKDGDSIDTDEEAATSAPNANKDTSKNVSGGNKISFTADDCKKKLGSDPFGLKGIGNCPGPVKNCYWEEYTKKMQLVSLMPIPDIEALYKRLFRYYPVAIQIPVPVPAPVVLPTLASGIPDPLISIPLPIIWKHIITLTLPVGMFVIWIGLCGPIPGPYIMYIDEQMNPMFLVSPKGPIQIPANSLKTQDIEDKSLIEMLKPLDLSFKIPFIEPFNSLMLGKKKIPGSFLKNDPDHPTVVIDNIRTKIKSATDSIDAADLTLDIDKEKLKRAKDAFKNFPPDIEAIQDTLASIGNTIDRAIDGMKISSIKFPKDPKRLAIPSLGFAEFLEDINKLLDTKIDLGLPIKTISLKNEIKKIFDRLLSDPDIKASFANINKEIEELEVNLAIQGGLDADKVKARVKKIKEAIKKVADKAAKIITPEMLGFVAALAIPIPLPFPCYDNVTIPPIPPYIAVIILAIKTLGDLIMGIPDSAFANALRIDLKSRLPRIDDMMTFIIDAMLIFVPELSFPDTQSGTVIKNTIKASIQNFFKFKIRPPHPGAMQITIPESLIKNLIKTAIKSAFAAVVTIIMGELMKAVNAEDVAKVLAVALIIKAIFSTDLGSITGNDIKAFLTSSLDLVDEKLEEIKNLLISIPKVDFKSLKETFFPPAISESLKKKPLKILREGPFLEVNTALMLDVTKPMLDILQKLNLPFPVILLGCALTPTRITLTKLHPFSPKQILPSWEMLSLKNIPWVIFLDQLVATAQRQGGLVSDYVIPYYLPDLPV